MEPVEQNFKEVWPQHIILAGDGITLWQNNHYLATLPSSFEASLNQEEEIIRISTKAWRKITNVRLLLSNK